MDAVNVPNGSSADIVTQLNAPPVGCLFEAVCSCLRVQIMLVTRTVCQLQWTRINEKGVCTAGSYLLGGGVFR